VLFPSYRYIRADAFEYERRGAGTGG